MNSDLRSHGRGDEGEIPAAFPLLEIRRRIKVAISLQDSRDYDLATERLVALYDELDQADAGYETDIAPLGESFWTELRRLQRGQDE